jgi:hypothetical protein
VPLCSNCGRDLPAGAVFCPDCGVSVDSRQAQSTEPSSYASSSSPTQQPTAASGDDGFGYFPPSYPEQKKRYLAGKKLLALVVIFALIIFLVGASLNNVAGPNKVAGNGTPVNSASTPVNGAELYGAYMANQSKANSAYTNKAIYIQDALDFGVAQDSGSGEYFSSVSSGNVVLIWSSQSQTHQLSQGARVLAECLVDGLQQSQGAGYLLYLANCNVVSVQAPTTTSTTTSVPLDNL